MSHVESMISNAHWTFGGGTILMLRYDHRFSKDIDLFVPDPNTSGTSIRGSEVPQRT
jgi:predicted nucleotidyltransferase component of viral defense system